tara:strand:+ start:1005 stop:1295 length:291 start_codon:yes stop_codon:yes gene_type:complete
MTIDVLTDAVAVLGVAPDEPDLIPISPPAGFIWMIGGAVSGDHGSYGLADVRVCRKGKTLDFVMTLAEAICLRRLLDQTIASMRELGDDERNDDEP